MVGEERLELSWFCFTDSPHCPDVPPIYRIACLFQLKVDFVYLLKLFFYVEDEGFEPSMKLLSLDSKPSAMPLGESSIFVENEDLILHQRALALYITYVNPRMLLPQASNL